MVHPSDKKSERQSTVFHSDKHAVLRNRLLLSIPPGELKSLRQQLEPHCFRQHEILHEPSERLRFAYFPNDGLISLVVSTEDGGTVEVGMVGREGFAGLAGAVGLRRTLLRQIVQIPGEGYRMKIERLEELLKASPHFQTAVCRYAVVMGLHVAQTAACNRLHDAGQRLTRWLLMARDRADLDALPITHDFLSTILGTDRPSVSLAAKILQRSGLIEYKRGRIVILNERKLEAVSCECYRVIRSFSQTIGKPRDRNW
jgi:CRP-like cAMP-binding protein